MKSTSEQKKRRETPLIAWFVLGICIASVVSRAVFGEFAYLGKTRDWVLEYSKWIIVAVGLISTLIVAGFVLVPFLVRRSRKGKGDL